MGWLFACFGHTTNKRKRPKRATNKFGPRSRRIRSYQPLQSDVSQQLGVLQPLTSSNLELRDETNDEKKPRIRKKVRFNLEVTTYEPIPNDDASSNSQDDEGDFNSDEREEEDEHAAAEACLVSLGHRYSNCYEDEDEYDDVDEYEDDDEDEECGISDIDDDGYGNDLIDPQKIYHEEITEEEYQNRFCTSLTSSGDGDLGLGTSNTRFRSHYIVPVLNPIENISQWKALKARKCYVMLQK